MEKLAGYVEHIIYRNTDNGYTVLNLVSGEDEITCVGIFSTIAEGENIEATGDYTDHPTYGTQFKVVSFEEKAPEDQEAIERYLGSGAIKGIGLAMAARIVRRFREDTFRIIEEEPERLAEVKGISERKAMEIASQVNEKRDLRQAMIFLQQFGITMNLAVKIYNKYGQEVYGILKENPYRLADDIEGVGFRTADDIAAKAGIRTDSDFRVRSGILYTLLQASGEGHTFLPQEELTAKTSELLGIDKDIIEKNYMDLSIERKIIMKQSGEQTQIYSASFYYMEANTATMLRELDIAYDVADAEIEQRIHNIEKQTGMQLDEHQVQAVKEAVRNGLLVITGGPGTGKTTTINTIIRYFEMEGMDIFLAAPTGRAAKRMSETTGWEAQTIHRLLEINGGVSEGDTQGAMHFERNEKQPLEADVVIIDEFSMVDIYLMNALLRAIVPGTRLIIVGDVNQLPSVGPGNVLKDMIQAEFCSVVRLHRIFRQAAESQIVMNAHRINSGEEISLENASPDFMHLERKDSASVINVVVQLIMQKLPPHVDASPYDIQVLTPTRKGELGVEHLNQVLQQYMNPADAGKVEREFHGVLFREKDKVMQIKNDYQIRWTKKTSLGDVYEEGTGVFNGDTGIIREIIPIAEQVVVEFEEGKMVEYEYSQMDEMELAYAITIHKSQGSEYPAIVLPVLGGPKMLLGRNLLYTAVTRAKKCVTTVGSSRVIQGMIHNVNEQKRFSSLCQRIKEMEEEDAELNH
mgnify:CR=1 FL=1